MVLENRKELYSHGFASGDSIRLVRTSRLIRDLKSRPMLSKFSLFQKTIACQNAASEVSVRDPRFKNFLSRADQGVKGSTFHDLLFFTLEIYIVRLTSNSKVGPNRLSGYRPRAYRVVGGRNFDDSTQTIFRRLVCPPQADFFSLEISARSK